ncbi:MAG: 23S rRNA (pseudouridine(1915)-N(3))-methyltransferase RlmH [Blastocatellia bacterium]|nr:23S rRNA (pseudouridine(1915)-N(3))-methyltransferase RlmH [Blastocatellia bacterium]
MKFRFLWLGKTKDKNWRALQEEYLGRLSHFVSCEISELKDSPVADTPETDGKRILAALHQKNVFVVLLDVQGRSVTSHQLAEIIENWQMDARKEIVFIIGGSKGVSSEVAERADLRLSLSFLTFTHEMARVLLLEQLFRGFSIIKGFPYQK